MLWLPITLSFSDFRFKLNRSPYVYQKPLYVHTKLKDTKCYNGLKTSVSDTIQYDDVYLTSSNKLTDSQLSLSHGVNKNLKEKN